MQTKTNYLCSEATFTRKVSNAKRFHAKAGDRIPHFVEYEEIKALALSESERKRVIAGSSIPMFDSGEQSKDGLCTYYLWGEQEISRLLDGLFVRGVTVLSCENLSRGDEEHPLLALFASELFDQWCFANQADSDYMRWGLAKKLADKPTNTLNKRIIKAFSKLNP